MKKENREMVNCILLYYLYFLFFISKKADLLAQLTFLTEVRVIDFGGMTDLKKNSNLGISNKKF